MPDLFVGKATTQILLNHSMNLKPHYNCNKVLFSPFVSSILQGFLLIDFFPINIVCYDFQMSHQLIS